MKLLLITWTSTRSSPVFISIQFEMEFFFEWHHQLIVAVELSQEHFLLGSYSSIVILCQNLRICSWCLSWTYRLHSVIPNVFSQLSVIVTLVLGEFGSVCMTTLWSLVQHSTHHHNHQQVRADSAGRYLLSVSVSLNSNHSLHYGLCSFQPNSMRLRCGVVMTKPYCLLFIRLVFNQWTRPENSSQRN